MKSKRGSRVCLLGLVLVFVLVVGGITLKAANFGDSIRVHSISGNLSFFNQWSFAQVRTDEGEIAYCIEPLKEGAPQKGSYQTTLVPVDFTGDFKVISAIIANGYPQNTWGFSPERAEAITYFAVKWYVMKGNDGPYYASIQDTSDFSARAAVVNLINYAMENPYVQPEISLALEDVTGEYKEELNVARKYQVKGSVQGKVSLMVDAPSGLGVQIPAEVNAGEFFSVTFPKKNALTSGSVKITASLSTSLRSQVILRADASSQSYLSFSSPLLEKTITTTFDYPPEVSDLKILKLDQETGEVLTGVKIRVWSKANGYSPKDKDDTKNLLGDFTTNEIGEILLEGSKWSLVPSAIGESLFLMEIEAPPGYRQIPKEGAGLLEVPFKEAGLTGTNKLTYKMLNEKEMPKVEKVDSLTKVPLEGVVFEIYNSDGTKAKVFSKQGLEEEEAGLLITDNDGQLVLPTGLKEGVYFLKEITPKEGYLENLKSYKFEVKQKELGANMVIENEKVRLSIFIQEEGYQVTQSFSNLNYIFPYIGNESNCSLSNFRWSSNLESKDLTVEEYKTGTYQEPSAYSLIMTTISGATNNITNLLIDQDDKLSKLKYLAPVNSWNMGNKTLKTEQILTNLEDWSLENTTQDLIKEITYTLSPGESTESIKLGVYGSGEYDVIGRSLLKENIILASGLSGLKSHEISASEPLVSYQLIFKKPLKIQGFTTGTFISYEEELPHTYDVEVETSLGRKLVWGEGFYSNQENKLLKSSLPLESGERIDKITTVFNEPVQAGFKTLLAPELRCRTLNLEEVSSLYFNNKPQELVIGKMVEVKGEYVPQSSFKVEREDLDLVASPFEVANGDEWDTTTYEGTLETKKMPKTGSNKYFIGVLIGLLGFLLVKKGDGENESKKYF